MPDVPSRFAIKRVYEPATPDDGMRVLVDRLWPRGLTKSAAHVDQWLKEVAPSTALRKWFHSDSSDPDHWKQFCHDYRAELAANAEAVDRLRHLSGKVTLLYGAHDKQHNHALVLLDVLQAS